MALVSHLWPFDVIVTEPATHVCKNLCYALYHTALHQCFSTETYICCVVILGCFDSTQEDMEESIHRLNDVQKSVALVFGRVATVGES